MQCRPVAWPHRCEDYSVKGRVDKNHPALRQGAVRQFGSSGAAKPRIRRGARPPGSMCGVKPVYRVSRESSDATLLARATMQYRAAAANRATKAPALMLAVAGAPSMRQRLSHQRSND